MFPFSGKCKTWSVFQQNGKRKTFAFFVSSKTEKKENRKTKTFWLFCFHFHFGFPGIKEENEYRNGKCFPLTFSYFSLFFSFSGNENAKLKMFSFPFSGVCFDFPICIFRFQKKGKRRNENRKTKTFSLFCFPFHFHFAGIEKEKERENIFCFLFLFFVSPEMKNAKRKCYCFPFPVSILHPSFPGKQKKYKQQSEDENVLTFPFRFLGIKGGNKIENVFHCSFLFFIYFSISQNEKCKTAVYK